MKQKINKYQLLTDLKLDTIVIYVLFYFLKIILQYKYLIQSISNDFSMCGK